MTLAGHFDLTRVTIERLGPLLDRLDRRGAEHAFWHKVGTYILARRASSKDPRGNVCVSGPFWGDRNFVEAFSEAIVENGYLDRMATR